MSALKQLITDYAAKSSLNDLVRRTAASLGKLNQFDKTLDEIPRNARARIDLSPAGLRMIEDAIKDAKAEIKRGWMLK